MEYSATYGTKRTSSQAFPERWCQHHSKRMRRMDKDLLPQEKLMEKEVRDLESRWDVLDDETQKIYESIGAVYDTLRRRIRAFHVHDDDITIDMGYREGISIVRELYNDSEKLMTSAKTAHTEAKNYEEMLLNNYVEYLKIRDNWLDTMKKLAKVTDQADASVFRTDDSKDGTSEAELHIDGISLDAWAKIIEGWQDMALIRAGTQTEALKPYWTSDTAITEGAMTDVDGALDELSDTEQIGAKDLDIADASSTDDDGYSTEGEPDELEIEEDEGDDNELEVDEEEVDTELLAYCRKTLAEDDDE